MVACWDHHFVFELMLTFISLFRSTQQQICVWGSRTTNILNGEYLQEGTINNHVYWKLDPASIPDDCSTNSSYLLYSSSVNAWAITSSNNTNTTNNINTHCSLSNSSLFVSNASICNKLWNHSPSLQISSGSCPILSCNAITIINEETDDCTGTYDIDLSSGNNIYKSDTNQHGRHVYLYFNIHTFKWYCGVQVEDQCEPTNYILSSKNASWFDIHSGQQIVLETFQDNILFGCDNISINDTSTIVTTSSQVTEKPYETPYVTADETTFVYDTTVNNENITTTDISTTTTTATVTTIGARTSTTTVTAQTTVSISLSASNTTTDTSETNAFSLSTFDIIIFIVIIAFLIIVIGLFCIIGIERRKRKKIVLDIERNILGGDGVALTRKQKRKRKRSRSRSKSPQSKSKSLSISLIDDGSIKDDVFTINEIKHDAMLNEMRHEESVGLESDDYTDNKRRNKKQDWNEWLA